MNRRILQVFLFAVALVAFASIAHAQYVPATLAAQHHSNSVTGGWNWLQTTSASITGNAGFTVQGSCGASASASCTFQVFPTTAGSDLTAGIVTGNSPSVTIASAYTCTNSAGCNSGNAIDTFTLCASSTCHQNTADDNDDLATVAGGVGGATYMTINLSGTPSNPYFELTEILPPKCGGSVCSSSVDAVTHSYGAAGTCTTSCTGNSMSITGTDGIVGIIDTNSTQTAQGAPYVIDNTGNMFALDVTSAPAFTITLTGFYTVTEVAFKSGGGSYSPTAPIFTWENPSLTSAGPTFGGPSRSGVQVNATCSPTCTFTPQTATGGTFTSPSGDILFIHAAGNQTISSITGRGTWVVPTGANTCQNTSVNDMSCGYVLSSTGGSGSIAVTMSGTCSSCSFAFYDIGRSSGSSALDAQNSSSGVGTTVISGQTLSVTGTDVCFDQITETGQTTTVSTYLYPFPGGANFFSSFIGVGPIGSSLLQLNTTSGAAPKVLMPSAATSSASTGVCFR
jgi:hypothetical protein